MAVYRWGQGVEEHELKDFAPDFALDISERDGTILLDMMNAIPTVKGYQAMNSLTSHIYGALPKTPIGSTVAIYQGGAAQHWAGTKDHLYRSFGTMDDPSSIWVQADQLGVGSFGATKWRFAQFNDDLIAVGGTGVAPLVATGSTGTFGPLGGSPPVGATTLVSVNAQVMMFAGPNWYVSALGSDNVWTPNIQTQAGSGTLYDAPGDVVAAAPLYRNIVIFKNTAMWLAQYVGGSAIWSFQLISGNTGTWGQESVVVMPDRIAFLGIDDFYTTTGYAPQRITNSLKEWFFDTADPQYLSSTLGRFDPYNALVYWHFVSKAPPYAGVPDRYVVWNARVGRWGAGYLNTPSVPQPNYHFGTPTDILGFVFDTNNVLKTFEGQPGNMMLKTSYFGQHGSFSQCLRAKPVYTVEPQSATLIPYHTASLGAADINGPTAVYNAKDRWYYFRQYDKWHRFQINTVGSSIQVTNNQQVGAEVTALLFEMRKGGIR